MKPLQKLSLGMLVAASVSLIATYFLPLWRIDLWAPQYPEGLSMYIWLNKLSGDVEIINGLNHYIGMAHIKEEMFPEFQILPYAVGFYIVFGLLTALLKSRKMLVSYLILMVLAGVVALYDFWRWGYQYGHNLSPDAAIKVPGMSYQPPLIGYKELLNFGAYSIPDTGGWVFIFAGILVATAVACEFYFCKEKPTRAAPRTFAPAAVAVVMGLGAMSFGCAEGPEPIRYGQDACVFCKMTIMDKKFAAEIVSDKGKAFKFDDLSCTVKYLKTNAIDENTLKFLVVNDYTRPGELIDARTAVFVNSRELRSPMRGDVAAFADRAAAEATKAQFADAKLLTWKEVYALF
jgi:copper chaperone NosL